MYKINVNYEDFNGKERNENLYFNINKPEVIKILKTRPTFQKELSDLADKLSQKETEDSVFIDFISFVDYLIEKSYGKKTPEGNFIKNADILGEFMSSNAYEALYTLFFNDPKTYDAFIAGIFPQDIMEQAMKDEKVQEQAAKLFGENSAEEPKSNS